MQLTAHPGRSNLLTRALHQQAESERADDPAPVPHKARGFLNRSVSWSSRRQSASRTRPSLAVQIRRSARCFLTARWIDYQFRKGHRACSCSAFWRVISATTCLCRAKPTSLGAAKTSVVLGALVEGSRNRRNPLRCSSMRPTDSLDARAPRSCSGMGDGDSGVGGSAVRGSGTWAARKITSLIASPPALNASAQTESCNWSISSIRRLRSSFEG